jgi:acyl-CoA reductase-like NAD-dependent aldehyde dehydrogenase
MPAETIPAKMITVTDPASGAVLRELPCCAAEDVDAAVARARTAQRTWSQTSLKQRLKVLQRFQHNLYQASDEVAALVAQETGKPRVEALLTEVVVVLDAASFLRRELPRMLRPERVSHGNPVMRMRRSYLVREPFGVIGIISPWNYPFLTPASETLAALATGNTVVLKPSELTPLSALRLKALLEEAGAPAGVLEVIIGDGATGAALSAAAVDKLIFTGSVATGKKVAEAAARRLVPVLLELGGKDAMLVLEDADLEIATSAAVWGAFMNAGQTCLSVERCYVHRSIFTAFVERCVEKANQLRVGRAEDPSSEVGPLISQNQLRTVEAHVADAIDHGAEIRAGGRRLPGLGPTFYMPTVITRVDHSMRVMKEETFGPLLPIMPFDTEEEAVALANDSVFGLAASVWTRDRARGEALARRIQAGTVMVNDVITGFGICEAPHGGVKQSGIGRTHGRAGIDEMVRLKYIDSDLLHRVSKVWWYGYGAEFAAQMHGFLDLLFAPNYARKLAGGLKAAGSLRRKNRL